MSRNDLTLKKMNPLSKDLDNILAHTESLWEELRDQRLFITGGTGFFGCWLLESFVWANDKLDLNASALVLTRDYEAFKNKMPHIASNPSIQFQIGDIRTFTFPKDTFSHIIHAATPGDARLNDENPLLMFDNIVEGTRRTLDFAVHCNAKKLLFTSSGAIYGKQPPHLTYIPEDYDGAPKPTDPGTAYGEGKRVAELLCMLYSIKYGIAPKIARCFAFVGPYLPLDIQYAVGNFIRDGLNGDPILVKGDGTPCRSYLYAADLMIWLWTILFVGQVCRPYNVGSEDVVTIAELAETVASCFSEPVEVKIIGTHIPDQPREQYIPSTKRAREECGLKQTTDLKKAIYKTIDFLLKKDFARLNDQERITVTER
jgi:nucleoside-diphosphate-sugar epimerase